MPSGPCRADARHRPSEAEAEAGDHLVTLEALLVIRVAILGLGIAVRADRELEAGAGAHAVEILADREVVDRAGGAVLIIESEASVGVARLHVAQHVAAERRAGAPADIEIAARVGAERVAGDQEAADLGDALLDVARKNAKIFQRYFKLKAKHLGVDKLRRYDIYAPIANSDKKFEYDDATKMVFDSFNSFDPQLAEMAQRVFDQEHVDSEVRKGKRDGAFCWSVLPAPPNLSMSAALSWPVAVSATSKVMMIVRLGYASNTS